MSGIWCSPLILGGAIAFILNVPMHALENRLFGKLKERGKAKKIARPASLALSILFVIIVIWIVLVVLIPEIGSTFTSLSRQIEVAIPKMEQWLTETFQNNDLIEEQINAVFSSLEFNWDRIIETALIFLRNGAGNVLGTTFSVAMTLINSVMKRSARLLRAISFCRRKNCLCRSGKYFMLSFPARWCGRY